MLEAWLNLSHREKARVFVMVRTRAIATSSQYIKRTETPPARKGGQRDSPTSGSQMNLSLTRARMARATQSRGWAYMASQKKRPSVALTTLVPGSLLSKTQWLSPEAGSTSFHQRRPTRRRPAMFLR